MTRSHLEKGPIVSEQTALGSRKFSKMSLWTFYHSDWAGDRYARYLCLRESQKQAHQVSSFSSTEGRLGWKVEDTVVSGPILCDKE